ncbi:uncharacterized protein H6S33_005301 [Morchella sextelata]|jgi:hypothetical protein|uniref:uncharacterized protein n=1 Tax=Morchella sextelata TaxID=1174677 RepID=UPI001D058FEC|nr:uncharacterized protein H6S33_005301 [Morchella sextelata]KAH0613415.1 hypothetical protein H6S33_005301 [Morchella sextelata]
MDESDLPRFDVDLEPVGDTNSVFRYQNAPGEIQRSIIVDRHTSVRSDLSIQGSLETVIHGNYLSNGPKATLIIARFQFMGSKPSRKFCSANISFKFRDEEGSLKFSVDKIAPSGQYCLNPSSSQEESKIGVGLNAGVNAIGGTAGGQTTYEITKSIERQDSGSFYGVSKTEGRNYGPKNAAKWSMSQNEAQKNGIPTALRLAILLKRQHDGPFFADIKVNAQVDILYNLECRMHNLSSSNKIHPILFDPNHHHPGNIPEGIDTDCLSLYPLEDLAGIEVTRQAHAV